MNTFVIAFLGGVVASLLWMFALAWLLDVLAAQRKALTDTQTTIRLYRDTRTQSDALIRELLDQNERLARRLIDQAADAECAPLVTRPEHVSPARRES